MNSELKAFVKHAQQLVGHTITAVLVDPDNEAYGFSATQGRSIKQVVVLMDPEGNGPGFLDISDIK